MSTTHLTNYPPGVTDADIDGEPDHCTCGRILRGGCCKVCDRPERDRSDFVQGADMTDPYIKLMQHINGTLMCLGGLYNVIEFGSPDQGEREMIIRAMRTANQTAEYTRKARDAYNKKAVTT